MSGSGATCFGLYPDCRAAAAALRMVKARRPGWWAVSTLLS
jgi:4-diphosphocytidyl-2-C-methyl-D-erythritol kinase